MTKRAFGFILIFLCAGVPIPKTTSHDPSRVPLCPSNAIHPSIARVRRRVISRRDHAVAPPRARGRERDLRSRAEMDDRARRGCRRRPGVHRHGAERVVGDAASRRRVARGRERKRRVRGVHGDGASMVSREREERWADADARERGGGLFPTAGVLARETERARDDDDDADDDDARGRGLTERFSRFDA